MGGLGAPSAPGASSRSGRKTGEPTAEKLRFSVTSSAKPRSKEAVSSGCPLFRNPRAVSLDSVRKNAAFFGHFDYPGRFP